MTDTDQIPDWPCPTIVLAEDGTVPVDGIRLQPPSALDQAATRRWVLAHVAEQYQQLQRPIRVTAREPDGREFPLILHPDGTTEAAPAIPSPRDKTARRPAARGSGGDPDSRRGLIAAGLFVVGVLAVAGIGYAVVNSGNSQPAPTAAPVAVRSTAPLLPPGANLPVPAPPGWTTRAVWAVPISSDSTPAVAPDGTIVALPPGRNLTVLDPATGATRWQTRLPDAASGTVLVTRIDGQMVAAIVSSERIDYWPLDPAAHPHRLVSLPTQASVSVLGDSPLVSLPDQTAGVITGGRLQTFDVPVGYTPLAANGAAVTAASAAGQWLTLTPGQAPSTPRRMAPPASGATLIRVLGIDGHRLAGVWAAGTQQAAVVYDAGTGSALASARIATGLETATACSSGPLVSLGGLLLDTEAHASGTGPVSSQCRAASGHLYLQDQSGTWYSVTSTHDSTALAPDAALPVGIAAGHALVTSDKIDQHLLYALQAGSSSVPGSGAASVATPNPAGQ